MKILRLMYTILILCRVLGVSRSGYYAWLNRKPSKHAQEEERLEVEIKAAHKRNRETAGCLFRSIRTPNPFLSERLFYDPFPAVSTV